MTEIAVTYFGIFDGHAGADAAVMTSKLLHLPMWSPLLSSQTCPCSHLYQAVKLAHVVTSIKQSNLPMWSSLLSSQTCPCGDI
jgi:serine/threonine protein phosphatase PrpC